MQTANIAHNEAHGEQILSADVSQPTPLLDYFLRYIR